MPSEARLTVTYRPVEDGRIEGRVLELPGVITVGQDIEEAKELIRDALVEYLDSYRDRTIIRAPRDGAIEEIEILI